MSKNTSFIDQTFSVIATILVKILPSSDREKQAFNFYRRGMAAQSDGEYSTALKNYYQSLLLYNIGLLHTNNGEHDRALEYYHQALERNPALPQALNNYLAEILFRKAEDYWKVAVDIAPLNYLEVQGWLKMRANK
uniref:photosystem I assembly protein Ycf3 n=1 Tax=Cephaleuros lagerheimii TaxID=2738443 RepID=UPI003001EBE0